MNDILSAGTTFFRVNFKSTITIKEIITHKKESGGKKVKLDEPIFVMQYDRKKNLTESETVQVEMKQSDVKSQISYNLWQQQ